MFVARWIVPVVLMLIGSCNIAKGCYAAKDMADSANWPSVRGRIVFSKVGSTSRAAKGGTGGGLGGRGSANSPSAGSTSYSVVVGYTYRVSDKEYRGTRIRIGGLPSFSKEAGAHELADRYPIGKAVDVYYSPDTPSKAVLERGGKPSHFVSFMGWVFAVVGFVWISFCIWLKIIRAKYRREHPES